MYPGFIHRWKSRHGGEGRFAAAGCGPVGGAWNWQEGWSYRAAPEEEGPHFGFGGSAFGVRRPLRFLAYKLQLDRSQVTELARILNDLKTERAQAAVDDRRTVTALADAVAGETWDEARIREGAALRVQSAERLRDAVVTALARIHKLLDAEQRSRLAHLIRTGILVL